MERILDRLERRIGGYAIPQLTAVIVAGMAAVFVIGSFRHSLLPQLELDLPAVRRGEVWRLVSYLFLPRTMEPVWLFFSLAFVWYVGSTLENHWGSFRFNLFYLVGCAGTTVAAYLTGHAETNQWLNYSLMLAFGTLFPDEEFYLFVVAVKAKWYAVFDALFLSYSFLTGDAALRAAILAALVGYFLFCGPALIALLRGQRIASRQAARRAVMSVKTEPPITGARVCAICGAREEDGTDIRICSCVKCGGPRALCLAHARDH